MSKSDYIGSRGEAIALARLTKICRPDADLPYLSPHFLGEKCETFDFLVEVIDVASESAFFFVQIKSTRKEFTKTQDPPRLRVEVSEEDVRRMAAYPAPTYLIGVHEREERVFVVCIHGAMSRGISSISTAHELDDATMRRLWDEVREYWRRREMTQVESSFTHEA